MNSSGLQRATSLPHFPTHSFLTFALAIPFMQGALFSVMNAGTDLARDVETGFLNRLALTPLSSASLLTGLLGGALVLGIVQAVVYLTVGVAAGASFAAGFPGVLVIVALSMLLAIGFGCIGLFVALRTGSGEAVQSMFPVFFVFLFLSSMNLPRNLIQTDWFREVATYNPVSYLIEAIRSLLIKGWDGEALALVFPLFFFTAFAGGLSSVSRVPGFNFPTGYTAFQFVFVVLQSSAFGGVFTGFGIARDFETGFGRRFLLIARHRSAIVVGYVMAALVRACVTLTILTAVALIAGMNIDGNGVDLFGLYGLGLTVNLAAVLWSAGVALRVRSIQGGPLMQIPVFLILFMAPVYVPLGLLTGWIHAVATVNPTTALLEAGRGFIAGRPTSVVLAFAVGAGLALLFTAWARGGLRRAESAG